MLGGLGDRLNAQRIEPGVPFPKLASTAELTYHRKCANVWIDVSSACPV